MPEHSMHHLMLSVMLPAVAAQPAPELRPAIDKALARISQGAGNYPKNSKCFSCHHQAIPVMALTSAELRGFGVEKDLVKKSVAFSLKSFQRTEQLVKGQGVGGANTTVAYALAMLASVDYPADNTTRALVQFLLARQGRDGDWPGVAQRPPSEGSPFTSSALALFVLDRYGQDQKLTAETRQRVTKAIERGKEWLVDSEPETTEDKAFALRGLVWAKAPAKDIAGARKALIDEQRGSGGWAQLADMTSDAYATGTVLMALRTAGMPPQDPVYQKGTKFLLSMQKEDGSWFVKTRSRPVQTFFDNGDPGGKSQFISMSATSWATLALLEHFPVKGR